MSVKQCPADPSHTVESTWKVCPHCGVKLQPDGSAEIGGHETLRAIAREEAEKIIKEREEKKPPEPVAANAKGDLIDDLMEQIF